MQANLSWLCFNQFLFFGSPLAKWPFPLGSFFSFFLPTCLTSLTSHIHLCDLTFVHPFINFARLLYIIIEEKMNSILLFRTSCSSKPISLCWLLSTCPTSSWAKTKCGLEHGVAHPTPIIHVNVYYVMGFRPFRPNYFTCTAHLYLYCTFLVPHTYASYIRHWCIFSHEEVQYKSSSISNMVSKPLL